MITVLNRVMEVSVEYGPQKNLHNLQTTLYVAEMIKRKEKIAI